jgi:hypothetical protein
MEVPQKIKIELPYNFCIPLVYRCPKESKSDNHVHHCIIHNSKIMESDWFPKNG